MSKELVPQKVSLVSQERIRLGAVLMHETQTQFMDRVVYDFFHDPVRVAHMKELRQAISEARPPLVDPDASREEIIKILNLPESDDQSA